MKAICGQYVQGRGAIGLLIVRLVFGLALMFHGYGKIQNPVGWMGPHAPVPGFLQACSALAEFGGGAAMILGVLIPLAALGLTINMLVAIFMHHVPHHDMFVNPKGASYESAAGYLAVALMLLFNGPGALSLDALILGRSNK